MLSDIIVSARTQNMLNLLALNKMSTLERKKKFCLEGSPAPLQTCEAIRKNFPFLTPPPWHLLRGTCPVIKHRLVVEHDTALAVCSEKISGALLLKSSYKGTISEYFRAT